MANPRQVLRIAIDFGGVLSIHDREKTVPGGEHMNVSINMPEAMDILWALKNNKELPVELYLISFAGKTRAKETYDSLTTCAPGLFDKYFFTKKKEFKKDICEHIGADIMIDDTLSILTDISNVNKNIQLYWFQGDPTFAVTSETIPENTKIMIAPSWSWLQEQINTSSFVQNVPRPTLDISKKIYTFI